MKQRFAFGRQCLLQHLACCVVAFNVVIGCSARNLGSNERELPTTSRDAGSNVTETPADTGSNATDAPTDADNKPDGEVAPETPPSCESESSITALQDGHFLAPSSFVLPPGSATETWRYAFSAPVTNWTEQNFDDSNWAQGSSGFYFGAAQSNESQRTPWPAENPNIWLRKTITLTAEQIKSVVFWVRWDELLTIFINGVEAVSETSANTGYRYLGMSRQARSALIAGQNTIAVHVKDTGDGKYFDLGITEKPELTARPSAGFERNPALAQYSRIVSDFMVTHGIPAGVLAVMKGDTVVVSRAFGWADKNFCKPLQQDAVLRLAGNDRWITIGAIRKLIDSGHVDAVTGQLITQDTLVFPLLEAHGLAPLANHTPDPRAYEITVRHLLEQKSGLNEPPADGAFYGDLQKSQGAELPEDNVRWAYSKAPAFAPGTREDANAISYVILRYLLQVLTGDLLAHLNALAPSPTGQDEIFIAHERAQHRSPREPWYATLQARYPRWIQLENATALAASGEGLVRYLRNRHLVSGASLIDPTTKLWTATGDNGHHYFLYGNPGAFSLLWQRRYDEVSLALLFNMNGDYSELFTELEELTNKLTADAWKLP